MWSMSARAPLGVKAKPSDANSLKLTLAAVGGLAIRIQGPIVGRAAERCFEKSEFGNLRVPGHAPVELVRLAESQKGADVRARRQKEVEDAVAVPPGEMSTEQLPDSWPGCPHAAHRRSPA